MTKYFKQLYKNKKGQPVVVGLMVFFMIIVVAIAMIPLLKDTLTDARDTEHLDCDGLRNSSFGSWVIGVSPSITLTCSEGTGIKYRYAKLNDVDSNGFADWTTYSTPFDIDTGIDTLYNLQYYCVGGTTGDPASLDGFVAATCIVTDLTFLYFLGTAIAAAGGFMWWRKGQA